LDDIIRRLGDLTDPSYKGIVAVIDILLVTFLIYRVLKLVRGTRAWKILIGIGVFVLALFLSERLQLNTLHWILERVSVLGPVALVILLLPELRQAIEGFARIGLLPERLLAGDSATHSTLEEVIEAATDMAHRKIGALIVIEREERLDDIARNGVPLKAEVTAALIEAIFYHGNPLHDGAAIIRNDLVYAAACRLPLSENPTLDAQYHMRHRAAIGVSENADCVVIVVSEERGDVSIAVNGELHSSKNIDDLRAMLAGLLIKEEDTQRPRRRFGKKASEEVESV
jgi:diadenylate cyclase